ncbi:MAG: tetratricopeptide repeat protein, partial [Bacteroidota bacterium]
QVHRAYAQMNKGDLAVEEGDMKLALREYGAAEKMFPENLEMKYWKAVAMTNNGQVDEAMPIFKLIFDEDPNWKELTRRLPASGLLLIEPELVEQILAL